MNHIIYFDSQHTNWHESLRHGSHTSGLQMSSNRAKLQELKDVEDDESGVLGLLREQVDFLLFLSSAVKLADCRRRTSSP